MTTVTMTGNRGTKRRLGKGWDALANPVPGDVLACLEELGIEVIRVSGSEAVGRCPEHEKNTGSPDRHPSWSCNTETGLYGCFSCKAGGTFVMLVEFCLGVDRSTAVAWVRARGSIERARRTLEGTDRIPGEKRRQINEAELALYTDPPLSACSKRLLDIDSVRHYGVLWDPQQDLWITPVREPDTGKLMGWQEKNDRYFNNYPYRLKKSLTLFGVDVFEGDQGILVESPLDAVRIHSVGITGALASYGAKVSEKQLKLIRDRTRNLILALDNDKDGLKYSETIRREYGKWFNLKFLNYNGIVGKDPGEMTADQIKQAIRTAIPSILMRF